MRLTFSYIVVIGSSGSLLSAVRPAPGWLEVVKQLPRKTMVETPPIDSVQLWTETPASARFHLTRTMLARGAFELASASRYGAAVVLFRSSHVLNRHVHGSGAAFDLRTDG